MLRANQLILTIYHDCPISSQNRTQAQNAYQKTQACTPGLLPLHPCASQRTLNVEYTFAMLCLYQSAPAMHVEGHE